MLHVCLCAAAVVVSWQTGFLAPLRGLDPTQLSASLICSGVQSEWYTINHHPGVYVDLPHHYNINTFKQLLACAIAEYST